MKSFKQFISESQEIDNELVSKAKDHFGLTNDHNEAGYVMHDGARLDLSGRHQMGGYTKTPTGSWRVNKGIDYAKGQRVVDHREVQDIVHSGGTEAMHEFMDKTSAVRHFPGQGFHSRKMPTPAQVKTIVQGHNQAHRNTPMYVDAEHNGEMHSKEINKPTVDNVTKHLKSVYGE